MFNLMNTVKLLSYRVKFDKSPQILRKYIEISEIPSFPQLYTL